MARVTVEDCVEKVPNRFELVLLAAQRARDLSVGAEMQVEKDNDKNPVIALREIAESKVDKEELTEEIIRNMQRHIEGDDGDEEAEDILAMEAEMAATAEVEAMIEQAGIDATLADARAAAEEAEQAAEAEAGDTDKAADSDQEENK